MEFSEFIQAYDGEDVGALALKRARLAGEVEDFDLALTTLECRRKLRAKVPEWYAVPALRYPLRLSAEQCSSAETARYKASVARAAATRAAVLSVKSGQFPDGGRLADLTGGLGVDSWAFAQVFREVLYNEMRPELADAARHNFAALGLTNIRVRSCELVPDSLASASSAHPASASADTSASGPSAGNVAAVLDGFQPDILFLDPARRAADGRKVFRLEDCQPDVLNLLPELLAAAPLVLLKLSPMADITLVARQLGCVREVHVVAADGECKELLLLLERGYEGPSATTIYESGAILPLDQVQGIIGPGPFSGAGPGPTEVPCSALQAICGGPGPGGKSGPGPNEGWTWSKGAILFEPGKALLKAGAFDLPCRYGLTQLDRHTHLYVTEGPVPAELALFGKCFAIIETVPLNNRTLKETGRKYPLAEVTARNQPLTSDQLRARLGVRSGGDIHIFGAKTVAGNVLIISKIAQLTGA